RPLDRHQVGRPFDHANHAVLARRIFADLAPRSVREAEAARAKHDALLHFEQRFGQRDHLFARTVEQVEGQARGGLFADSGQPRKLAHQPRHRGGQAVLALYIFRHNLGLLAIQSSPMPGSFNPASGPASLPISVVTRSCARRRASLIATTSKSWIIARSLAASSAGSISIFRSRIEPSATTLTIPPPACASTVLAAASSCICLSRPCSACACCIRAERSKFATGLTPLPGCAP